MNLMKKKVQLSIMIKSFLIKGKFMCAKGFLKQKMKTIRSSSRRGKCHKNNTNGLFLEKYLSNTLQHNNIFLCVRSF